MKYFTLLLALLIFLAGCSLEVKTTEISTYQENEIEKTNRESIDVADLDSLDSWLYYENRNANFSLKYPANVKMIKGTNSENINLEITTEEVIGLEGQMGYNQETALSNYEFLNAGFYGEDVDFPYPDSKRLIELSENKAQDFYVFGRFDVCDTRVERFAYFFKNGYQVIIKLSANIESVIAENPSYFTDDLENCGQKQRWADNGLDRFYQDLLADSVAGLAGELHQIFEAIIDTYEDTGNLDI